jgi:hypothetical protein
MFSVDEKYIARFYTAQQEAADVINELNSDNHETACDNAAKNAIKTGQPPVTVTAERKRRPKTDSFPEGGFELLNVPCSDRTPADYMPKDVAGEVGQGIGALIPYTTRSYYDRTNQMHETGEPREVNGMKFLYSRETPFKGFWVKQ